MLNAVLIDDEQNSIDVLTFELAQNCPNVNIIKTFTDVEQALQYLNLNNIDVVFLDISMPQMNGFEFLANFKNVFFDVIFVTAYEEYALQAFDFYAVDYLVKPVVPHKLARAVDRIKSKRKEQTESQRFDLLMNSLQSVYQKSSTLAIPTLEGFEMVEYEDIVCLNAEGNYSEIILKSRKILVSKSLGDFEKVLDSKMFVRIHNSHIINISEIKKYIRGDGGFVQLSHGKQLPVSRINKPRLLSIIKVDF